MLTQSHERRLIFISGLQVSALSAAEQLIQRSALDEKSIYRHHPTATVHSELGRDFAVVLIDAYQGLNPDTIGRVSGTVVAGGALIIVCPEKSAWADYADPEKTKLAPYATPITDVSGHYITRWTGLLEKMHGISWLKPEQVQTVTPIRPYYIDTAADKAITADQHQAVEAICKAANGHRKQPAIITASRGRGKSAAMGLAAGALIQAGESCNIIVTSSNFGQLKSLFKHAQAVLSEAQFDPDKKTLQHAQGCLRFVSADLLIAQPENCDLLLIDEAASLGVARLIQLLKTYPRLAFSSTEHGYEGSGRGFSLKFKQLIHHYCRGQHAVSLTKPIRWREHDPLEAWTNELLLLEANTVAHPGQVVCFETLTFNLLSQQQLANDESLLKSVFALLVDAHYQTRPVDLRYLLDAPNTRLWAAHQNGELVGLVWIMLEGGLNIDIAAEIVAGRRRPQGHLAPQILGAHLGLDEAITLNCARIQRIVVHPDLQHQGLGNWMLKTVQAQLASEIDYLASSFGADLSLCRFWRQADYQVVRLSDQPHAASGLRSALVIKAVSDGARAMAKTATQHYAEQLICQLGNSLAEESPALVIELAPTSTLLPPPMQASELKTACLFAYGQRPYESSLPALMHLGRQLLLRAEDRGGLSSEQTGLYIARVLQYQPWALCAQNAGLNGKKACVQSLRLSSQILLEQSYPGKSLQAIRSKYSLGKV